MPRYDMNRNRGRARIVLQAVEQRPSAHVGQSHVHGDRRGLILPRQSATDRETEPRPAVSSAGSSIGLLKSLEDNSLLLLRDPDPRVDDGKRDYVLRPVEHRVGTAPSTGNQVHLQFYGAVLGELK